MMTMPSFPFAAMPYATAVPWSLFDVGAPVMVLPPPPPPRTGACSDRAVTGCRGCVAGSASPAPARHRARYDKRWRNLAISTRSGGLDARNGILSEAKIVRSKLRCAAGLNAASCTPSACAVTRVAPAAGVRRCNGVPAAGSRCIGRRGLRA